MYWVAINDKNFLKGPNITFSHSSPINLGLEWLRNRNKLFLERQIGSLGRLDHLHIILLTTKDFDKKIDLCVTVCSLCIRDQIMINLSQHRILWQKFDFVSWAISQPEVEPMQSTSSFYFKSFFSKLLHPLIKTNRHALHIILLLV